MPNLAFHLEVLDKVIADLTTAGDPRGALMNSNKKFAVLGALGPDMLRYLPISNSLSTTLSGLAQQTPVGQISLTTLTPVQLEELFLNPVGAIYSLLFRQVVVPNWLTLNEVTAFLNKLDAIAAAQNELAIPGILSELQTILNKATALETALPQQVQNTASVIGQIIGLPPWMEQTMTVPTAPSDPRANRLSEFLRWHKSGEFAENLLAAATTNEEKAFALGWITHFASSVTGEPFINNITGGPYRTHWWRNRLVSNFVDAWTFGFFESGASMAGDNPTPPYANWQSLCTANLQDLFNIAGLTDGTGGDVPDAVKAMASGNLGSLPGQFPAVIAHLLEATVNKTYPTATQPIAGFTAAKFADAFVGSFAVYWFMTSGSGPMGINVVGTPSASCATPPSWISSGSAPTPAQAGLNSSGATCAEILAILALLFFCFGDIPSGLAALGAALAQPIINWGVVTCNLFWLRNTLVTAENGLQNALVAGGLAYPQPAKLGTIDASNQTHPAVDLSAPTGVPLTKTNAFGVQPPPSVEVPGIFGYPRVMDASVTAPDLNFGAFPKTKVEDPATINTIAPSHYPNFVVNGAGLLNGGMLVAGPFPSRDVSFGDAVANALQAIKSDKLQDYNLDGDRGSGWTGWHPASGSLPSAPPVNAVHD